MIDRFEYFCLSPIGAIRLTTTDNALTHLDFVEKSGQNLALEDYPQVMKTAISELGLYFKGKLKVFTINIQQETTPFRQRVYEKLMEIPYGETISYKELAAKIENPKAVRAVGGANHHNNIPIIVPCHRVIGANGALTGYGGGISKKKFLLELEGRKL